MVLYPLPGCQFLLKQVPLVEEDDERFVTEVDVVNHRVEKLEALLHAVGLAVLKKNLERKKERSLRISAEKG